MASDNSGMDVPSAKESNESGGSNDEGGNTDVFNKIRSLFGNEIYESLQKEEINSPELIADLADRDADAPIFGKLGFTYGKAARFKKEFETKKASYGSAHARPCSPAPSKPTMAEMSSFTPEIKRLYLSKRKKIGILATSKWGSSCPKFNTPELKTELKEFCTEIASECAIPEINFNEEGIANHVKTFFSEQRRYKKNKSPSTKAAETRKIEATGQRKKPKGGDLSFEEMSGGSSETENSIQGGDTDSVEDEDEEESMLKSPPSSQVPPLPAIERINDNEEGTVDMDMLEEKLQMYRSADYNIYVAFSAASNVTGILTDTVAVAELCHKYGALSFWDYASAAPYLKIDMNPTPNGYKDAVFLSPHKFVGGPGTPGLLIAKKSVFRNPVPGGCGGGTVLFVTRDTHLYLKDIEEREEGGTPAIVESIRAGMVFQLKQSVGTDVIEEREEQLCKKAFDALNDNPNLTILGNDMARRLPIFSMIFYHQDSGKLVHHNFVSVLLNDLYGIQARGGCACAGPYAQELLGLNETLLRKFMWFLEKHENDSLGGLLKEPLEIMKPGFVRVGLPYFMNDKTVDFVLNAVNMVATHGWKLLPQYHFDPYTGAWEHKQFKRDKGETLFSLYDVSYDEVGVSISSKSICKDYEGALDDIAESARRVFEDAVNVNKEISTVEDEVVEFTDDKNQLVWFLQPNEAQFFLAAETLKFKPKPFGKAKTPFTPVHGHSPQITPASSNPSLHLYTVKPDSDTSRSAESSESEDHVHNCVAREAWGTGEIIGSYSGGKKKRNCFCKLKRVLKKIGK